MPLLTEGAAGFAQVPLITPKRDREVTILLSARSQWHKILAAEPDSIFILTVSSNRSLAEFNIRTQSHQCPRLTASLLLYATRKESRWYFTDQDFRKP